MSDDFVRRLVAILGETPRTAWEARIRFEYGGERVVIRRSPPSDDAQRIAELRRAGIPERTARWKIRGK